MCVVQFQRNKCVYYVTNANTMDSFTNVHISVSFDYLHVQIKSRNETNSNVANVHHNGLFMRIGLMCQVTVHTHHRFACIGKLSLICISVNKVSALKRMLMNGALSHRCLNIECASTRTQHF